MKSLRFVCLFAIFCLANLMIVLVAAQFNPVTSTHQPSVLPKTQNLAAEMAAQPVPARQKPRINFAPAAAYDSDGPLAESVAIADLNGDGKPDLVVANACGSEPLCASPGEVAVLLSNGDGTFQSAVIYSTGAYFADWVVVGDLNGDGKPDLVVANDCQAIHYEQCTGPGTLAVLLGNGDGTFQPAVPYIMPDEGAGSVAIGDVNGDGIPDLIVSISCVVSGQSCDLGAVGVLLGNGDGTFQPAVVYNSGGYYTGSVAIGDMNGDGIPDLIVSGCGDYTCSGYYGEGEVGVLLGNGDGTFQPAAIYDSGGYHTGSVVVGNLRGNGILDVVVRNDGHEVAVLLGNGDGTLQAPVSYNLVGWGFDAVTIGDVDGDGIPDLVAVVECRYFAPYRCLGTGRMNVLLGNGDGTFEGPLVYSSGGYEAWAVAIGDVNGDGRPDVVVANNCQDQNCNDGSVSFLLNETSYSTKTALTSSPNPSHVNQAIAFTATIASTPPVPNGGVVTFYNNKTSLGTGKTANGVATLTTSFSKAKTYTIKASYPGDAFRKASSGTVKQVVSP